MIITFLFFLHSGITQVISGFRLQKNKAFLVPEAENDPALKLSTTQELFQNVKGIFYNVPEERSINFKSCKI